MRSDIVVIGGGIFGLTAAIALKDRGHPVTVVDQGPIPHPLAASTDISKVVRMEYGADDQYMEMVEASLPIWRDWNQEFGERLFHETGMCILTREPMAKGGFEFESFHTLTRRGHQPERLDADSIQRRFPAWSPTFVDGFYHAKGGFAESGRVVSSLASVARTKGVDVQEGVAVQRVETENGSVCGIRTKTDDAIRADRVLVAAGAWARYLVPDINSATEVSGHPVFHLTPYQPELFSGELFPTFMADVSRTGWYGFPVHPVEGVIKVANHGIGVQQHPDDPRVITDADEVGLRHFLRETFPMLANAPIVYTRRCLYSDTLDGHLWIDRHPDVDGLFVATGGSGHAFKLAPVLGPLIADSVEAKSNRWLAKFAWRQLASDTTGEEASRHRSD